MARASPPAAAAVLFVAGMVGAAIPPPSPSPPPPAASPPPDPPAVPEPPSPPPYPPIAPMTCQWATSATASSQYSATCAKGSSQHACEVTGAPDVAPTCGDLAKAWSPSTSASTAEWLEVTFGNSLMRLHTVTIYETYRAPFVTKVEAALGASTRTTIWQGTDTTSYGCFWLRADRRGSGLWRDHTLPTLASALAPKPAICSAPLLLGSGRGLRDRQLGQRRCSAT